MSLNTIFSKGNSFVSLISYLSSNSRSIHYTGWIGHKNLGDELLLEAAAECFSPADVLWVREYGSAGVNAVLRYKRHEIAMLGGGTQIGEISPINRFRAALERSKSGVVFGAGVTPSLHGAVPAWLSDWGRLLTGIEYVGVRGPESAATLERVGVRAEVLGDPVCWFTKPMEYWQPRSGSIGVNVGHSNGHMYGDERVIRERISDLVRVLRGRGFEIEFFCVWPDDLPTTMEVARMAGILSPIVHQTYVRAESFQEQVRRMELFVGIKLHAVALAMCTNVPAIMVEYRPKCREFMGTMGVEFLTVRSDDIEVDKLLDLVAEVISNKLSISKSINEHALIIKKRLQDVAVNLLGAHDWECGRP